jgi:UDP-N-acetylmuramate dehydrogenase
MKTEWFRENRAGFSGDLLFDEPLSRHTYYRIGGPAAVLAIPKSKLDVQWLQTGLEATQAPLFVMGFGSNILASDEGFSGLILRTTKLNLEISGESDTVIRTGGSVAISSLMRRASQEGWGGLEFLTGIPGSVGGAVFMNAGTHLGEASRALLGVEWLSLEGDDRTFSGDELKYQYRKNLFLPSRGLVWSARWQIASREPTQVKSLIDETLARRKATQPLDFPSCGSVFKNPKESGLAAWQVIEKLGLKGHQIGGAQFSTKHSNWILNLGSARARDVLDLIALAKARALGELGIKLEEEVRVL